MKLSHGVRVRPIHGICSVLGARLDLIGLVCFIASFASGRYEEVANVDHENLVL